MGAVVYARVADSLKHALQEHASERGLSLTRAVVELVERGLEAIANETSVEAREQRLRALASELEGTRARVREAELAVQAAREREQLTARTYRAVAERSRQELVLCPRCRQPVRGSDLLVSGCCPHCRKGLTSLLTPTPRAGLDSNEYLALMGALGVLVGLALASAAESGNPEAAFPL
jgi:hypothetical protein